MDNGTSRSMSLFCSMLPPHLAYSSRRVVWLSLVNIVLPVQIIRYAPQSTQRVACTVSKHFHTLFTPVLYSKVDFGVHRQRKNNQAVQQETNSEICHIVIQQYRFMKTIKQKVEYALFVKELTWAIGVSRQPIAVLT